MAVQWRISDATSRWELPQSDPLVAPWKDVPRATPPIDRRRLEEELTDALDGEVRFDEGSRALYATDSSNYRQVPIGVVIPRSYEDVVATINIARRYGAPILSRGGGTSLAGQCCNVAIVMDFSKYLNQVISIDTRSKTARVMPGTVLDHLDGPARKLGLIFGPDPATHSRCTLGGMIGNNSCGMHAQMAGRTSDNVLELEIVTYEGHRMRVGETSPEELERIIRAGGPKGEIYAKLKSLRDRYANLIRARFPKIPRRISGYNLDDLLPEKGFNVARALVGSESTLVTILEAKLRLVDDPKCRSLLVLGYPSVYEAADHITEIVKHSPIGLEGMDDRLIHYMQKKQNPDTQYIDLLPDGKGWLMVEFGGASKVESDMRARALITELKSRGSAPSFKLFDSREEEEHLWKMREGGLGATARVPGQKDTWEGWEDSAVPPEKLGEYLRELRKLMEKHGYTEPTLYGHFGQACVHTRIEFDFESADGIRNYRSFIEEASDLVVRLGGSFSGEHGDGQSRGELLPKMFGPELMEAFREFKSIWDPQWKMNPGKVIDAYRIDENLRLGVTYNPAHPKTHFKFPDDKGDLSYASLRCVGVGLCRRSEGGTMCPSYMVTHEEKHSTRGRAHLLHEMLVGDVIKDGWRSEAVKSALDLCLACKGCKSDCPLNVDMATYKAEFLSHYYEGRVRPITAYSMGLIDVWARIASKMPRLVNFFTQTPILRDIAKVMAGIAPQRRIPRFATWTFKDWYHKRGPRGADRPPVILWADTFNNHFHPDTAKAALEVLEEAGFHVIVHQKHLCCGRPLYDFGMLNLAKSYLRKVVSELRPLIRAGVPVIGIEPSCTSVFRDELRNLFPNDLDCAKLSAQTYFLSEFLEQKAPDFLKRFEGETGLGRKAIVQGHCHHKSVLKFENEKSVMKKIGLDADVLEAGCCGMAGSFGFEKEGDRYEVSMKCGERKLLPEVRRASRDTLVIADGFSCREQIKQGTGREPIHLAQAVRMALARNEAGKVNQRKTISKRGETMFARKRLSQESRTPRRALFDPSESFREALVRSREESGEPPVTFEDARAWVSRNPRSYVLGGIASALLAGIGILFFRRKSIAGRATRGKAA